MSDQKNWRLSPRRELWTGHIPHSSLVLLLLHLDMMLKYSSHSMGCSV